MKINLNILSNKFKRIPVKKLTLMLSIIGVCVLYGLSLFQQPILLTSLQSIEDFEGKEVTISGTILDYTTTNYGSQLITIQCNKKDLTIFSENTLPIHKGDTIQATGTVQKYKDSWELIISNPKSTKITSNWQNKTIEISELAKHPKDYQNIPLNITGCIDLKYNDLIYLTDQSKNYSIPLIQSNLSLPDTGTNVFVHATLTYDPLHLRYILTECEKIQLEPSQNEEFQ